MNKHLQLIENIKILISNLEDLIKETYEQFQSGRELEGMENMPELIDGLQYCIENIVINKEILEYDINIQEVNERLRELMNALENEDNVLIADILQYEIYIMVNEWGNFIKNMK